MKLAILMVVSQNEQLLAGDSLRRAAACLPDGVEALCIVANNTGSSLSFEGLEKFDELKISELPFTPRPYFEIGRSIFSALKTATGEQLDILIKVDPDTLILSSGFFSDYCGLMESLSADFIAAHTVYRKKFDNMKRVSRLLADCLPFGLARFDGNTRYGRGIKLRFGRAWHARSTLRAARRGKFPIAQPSGGGYGISGRILERLSAVGWLEPKGPNGLEWNDDTIMPISILALGGKTVDIRETAFRENWRWMHGSRYFNEKDIHAAGLRAVHPLKNNREDWALRNKIAVPV